MLSLLRRITTNKPLAFSAVAVLVLAIAIPLASAVLVAPQQVTAQQGGPPGGAGLVVRTAPASVGPISTVLSYAGAVQAGQQVNVVPRTSGIVTDIPVDVGSAVHKGDTLATLDQGALPAQLQQAQANLLAARAKLAQVEAGARPEDVAAANAQLEQAQIKLVQLEAGRPEDVRTAQSNLDAAKAKLQALLNGPTDDTRQADQSAVDADVAAVAAAQAGLDNFNGSSASDIQAAQSAVDSDKAALSSAQAALANLRGTNVSDLQAAQTAVDTDNAQIQSAQAALTALSGTTAADQQNLQSNVNADLSLVAAAQAAIDQANSPPDAQIEAARQLVDAAQASIDAANSTEAVLKNPVKPTLSPNGTSSGGTTGACALTAGGSTVSSAQCDAAKTAADSAVSASQQQLTSAQAALTQLLNGGPPATKVQLQSNLVSAQEKLKTDQARLAAEKNTIASQQASAQSTLTSTQEKLKADQAKLDSLTNGTFQSQQSSAESTLVSAQQKLKADQAKLDAINNGTEAAQLAQLQSTLTAAQQKQISDQAKLDVLNGGPLPTDVQQAQDAVNVAQQALTKAQIPGADTDIAMQQSVVDQMYQTAVGRQDAYTDADMQAAVAGVAQAEAGVSLAQANLDQTTVVAPFDGVIGSRAVTAGAYATPATAILTLASTGVEVHVTVEEANLASVQPGQDVTLTVPAYPGVNFPAKVVTIAPSGDPRAHTFDVKIVPNTQDQRLLPGMFAQVQIVAQQKPDALLIPKEALVQQGNQQIVFVADNGHAVATPVQTGMTNDTSVEITSGLTPGAQVVVIGQNGLRDGAPIQVVQPGGQGGGGQGQGGQGGGQGGGGAQGQAGQAGGAAQGQAGQGGGAAQGGAGGGQAQNGGAGAGQQGQGGGQGQQPAAPSGGG
ncbi:MAG: efflux RND transporter periplasmic adaptor subunit [Chloroflexi bacterium]|nr:efflux RND transporter periplasmic adaptor subunit [Chloroflexota bacterium]